MTITSAVYVPDGIAMAADSRLTGYRTDPAGIEERFTLSDNAQKIVLVRNESIGISFAGDAIIDQKTVSDFIRIFDIKEVQDTDTVEEVALKLQNYLLNHYNNYFVIFFVAGFDNELPFVYRVSKDLFFHANAGMVYGAVWEGERETADKLIVGTPIEFQLMPLKDAIDFSEFVVDATINYSRFKQGISTCGGPIDVLVITKDYTKFFKHKILQP